MTSRKRSLWGILYRFHRYTGLSTGIIILMLAVTGIALNHTDALMLDKHYVKSPAILDWYGIAEPELQSSFAIQQLWLSQSEQTIYLNDQAIFKTATPIVGATINASYITVAFKDALLLLTPEGEVIEQINKKAIQKIGMDQAGRVIIQSQNVIYVSDDDFLSWQVSASPTPQWSTPETLPIHLKQQIANSSRHFILPYERVMLDVHSGRFFGTYGVYFIDLSAILFILLAITGTWIWLKHWIKHQLKLCQRARR